MKIRTKLIISFLFFLIPFLLLAIFTNIVFEKEAKGHALARVKFYSHTFALTIGRELENDNKRPLFFSPEDLQDYIHDFYFLQKIDMVVVDTNKTIVADIIKSEIGKKYNFDKNNEVLLSIRDGSDRIFKEVSGAYPKGILLYVHSIKTENGKILGALLIKYSSILKESEADINKVRQIVLYAVLVFIFISILLGFVLSKKIRMPISNLINAAEKFSNGDYSVRIRSERKDELGELGKAFDQMIEQRQKSEDQILLLSNTIKSANDLIAIADVNFNFLFANDAFCRVFGYSQEELLGQFVGTLISVKNDTNIINSNLLIDGWLGEQWGKSKDGREFLVELRISPVINLSGNTIATVAVANDITEKKKLEAELVESKHRLEMLVTSSTTMLYSSEAFGDFDAIFISGNFSSITGYDIGDFYKKGWWANNIHPDDVQNVFNNLGELLKKGNQSLEYRFLFKDGSWHWMHDDLKLIKDESGNPLELIGTWQDVTKQKLAEEALKERENSYRTLAENLPASVYRLYLREQGKMEFFNDVIEQISGYTRDELRKGKICSIDPFILSEDKPHIMEIVNNAVKNDIEFEVEYRFINKDGRLRYFSEKGRPVNGEDGKPLYIEGVIFDITYRKNAVEELKESQLKFRNIVEGTKALLFSTTERGRFTYLNEAACDTLGVKFQDLIGKFYLRFVHPDNRSITHSVFTEQLVNPTPNKSLDIRIITKGGNDGWFNLLINPVYKDGKVAGLSSVALDITTRKIAEEALRESEKRYREFADFLPQPVFEYDMNGRFTFANQTSMKATGYKQEDIRNGLTIFNLIDPAQHNIVIEMMEKRTDKNPADGAEYKIIRKDGTSFPAMGFVSPIKDGNKVVGLRGLIIDITEKNKTEDILKLNAARLKMLNDIGSKIVSTLDLDLIIDRAVKLVHDNFKYNHVSLLTYNEEQDYVIVKSIAGAFINLFKRNSKVHLEEGMIIWAAKTGNIAIANDVDIDPHYVNVYPDMVNTRSELCIPLKIGTKVFGILDLQCTKQNAFSEEDINVLATLSDQIALAINNSLLYESVQKELLERIKTEEALTKSEEKYRMVFANVPLGIANFNSTGLLTDCNDIFLQIFDVGKKDSAGFNLMELEDKKINEAFKTALTGLVQIFEGNYRSVISKKIIPLKASFAPIIEKDGRIMNIVGIFEDISERKQVERFFFHDILNTAGNLRNYADFLNDDSISDQEKESIKNSMVLLSKQMIDEIVSHRVILTSDKSVIKLNIMGLNTLNLVTNTIDNFKQSTEKDNKQLVIDDEFEAMEIKTDATILGRIIGNLIKNAVEASLPGNIVTVGCLNEEDSGRVKFMVHNQTVIPEENRSKIFQRSFSTKGEGRGIGTYSIKFLTEEYLKGEVFFTSNQDDGTTFYVVIPKII